MPYFTYSYFTNFYCRCNLTDQGDYEKSFEVDSNTHFIVQGKQGDENCKFTLYAKCNIDDPDHHNPGDFRAYAKELICFHDIARMAIAYQTGYIVKPQDFIKLGSPITHFSSLPEISHDFFERLEERGIKNKLLRNANKEFYMNGYIVLQYNEQRLQILKNIVVNVKNDTTKVKYKILEMFFKGWIDQTENPYPHWDMIVETAGNPKYRLISKKQFYSDEILINSERVDIRFLRHYGNYRRHSPYHEDADRSKKKLSDNPKHVDYLNDDDNGAKQYYLTNLRIIMDYFLLNLII